MLEMHSVYLLQNEEKKKVTKLSPNELYLRVRLRLRYREPALKTKKKKIYIYKNRKERRVLAHFVRQ